MNRHVCGDEIGATCLPVGIWTLRAPTNARVCGAQSRGIHSSPLCTLSVQISTPPRRWIRWEIRHGFVHYSRTYEIYVLCFVYTYTYIYTYMYTHTYIYIYIYMYIYIYIYKYIFIYFMYIYIHIYIDIFYIYTHTHVIHHLLPGGRLGTGPLPGHESSSSVIQPARSPSFGLLLSILDLV